MNERKEDIYPCMNEKAHGYQEYYKRDGSFLYRGRHKNGRPLGYTERHSYKTCRFFIK